MKNKLITLLVISCAMCFACACANAPVYPRIDAGTVAASRAATDFTLTVSSSLNDPSIDAGSANLTDGDTETLWYSQWADEKNPACNEWILLDFGSVRKVESVTLTPNEQRICFPADFNIGWGVTGDVFPAVRGFEFTDYGLSGAASETFNVNVVTRYIRIHVTKRSANGDGNYLVSLSEVSANVRNATAVEIENAEKADSEIVRRPVVDDPVIPSAASASSSLNNVEGTSGWAVKNINDGSVATQWCAEWGSNINNETCEEWIVLTFGKPQYVRGVSIRSQLAAHYGFPKAFDLQWTLDGEHFFTVSGASYTDEPTGDTLHIKVFDSPVTATAVRMDIKSSRIDSGGNYIPQLAEFQAHGREATDDEVSAATRVFNDLVGSGPASVEKDGAGIGMDGVAGSLMLFFAIALFGAGVGLAIVLVWEFSKKRARRVNSAKAQCPEVSTCGQNDAVKDKEDRDEYEN